MRFGLFPPFYVKAYVKRGKSDALDAEAICEAVQRPTMRFVPVKTVEQQAILMTHRARSLLVRQRTMTANALRAHLAEFGLVANRHRPSGEAGRASARRRGCTAGLCPARAGSSPPGSG